MMRRTKFIHVPLDFTSKHIRLIRFQPKRGSYFKFSLHNYTFSDCPPYKAVSYTWAPHNPPRGITLNEKTLHIGDNLWQFLNTVQDDSKSYFWIDQICIDQANADERNHQVAFMDEIFHNAAEVLVWLGVNSADSDRAMDFIQAIEPQNISKAIAHPWASQLDCSPNVGSWIGFYKHIPINTRSLPIGGLKALFRRRYWTRLWVIQEIMQARRLLLLCGDRCIQWAALEAFQDWIRLNRELKFNQFHNTKGILPRPVHSILESKRRWGHGHEWTASYRSLRHVITTYADFECELAVDKVYGLLGLVFPEDRVEADYTSRKQSVIVEVLINVTMEENTSASGIVNLGVTLTHGMGLQDHKEMILQALDEIDKEIIFLGNNLLGVSTNDLLDTLKLLDTLEIKRYQVLIEIMNNWWIDPTLDELVQKETHSWERKCEKWDRYKSGLVPNNHLKLKHIHRSRFRNDEKRSFDGAAVGV